MSQCDDQTFGSVAETLVIQFNQERFEQFLFGGSTSPLHREVSVARAPLANSWKQVSVETNKTLCKPIIVSGEAKQTLCESSTVSAENIASRQHVNTVREATKVPREPKTTSAKAMWIAKAVVPCEAIDRSLDCKIISALHRAKPRLSREARAKALCANSEATAAPLTSTALLCSARLTARNKTKALSA